MLCPKSRLGSHPLDSSAASRNICFTAVSIGRKFVVDQVIVMTKKLSPVHPGEVLLEEFIKPMNLSQNRLAIDIGVDARRINEIVLGKRAITADTALRLSRFFGNSPQFWMGLQTQYDLDVAEDQLGSRLDREVRPLAMAG